MSRDTESQLVNEHEGDPLVDASLVPSNFVILKSLSNKVWPFVGVNLIEAGSSFIIGVIFGNSSDNAAAAMAFIALIEQGYYALIGSVFNPTGNLTGQLYGKVLELEKKTAPNEENGVKNSIDEPKEEPLVIFSSSESFPEDINDRKDDQSSIIQRDGEAVGGLLQRNVNSDRLNISRGKEADSLSASEDLSSQSFGEEAGISEVVENLRKRMRGIVQITVIASLLASIPMTIGVTYTGPVLKSLGVNQTITDMVDDFVGSYAFAVPGSLMLQILIDFTSYCGGERSLVWLNLLGNVLKILISAIFTYGWLGFPKLEAKGLGWGTVISTYTSLIVYAGYLLKSELFKGYKLYKLQLQLLKNSLRSLWQIIKLGFPVSAFNTAEFVALLYVSILLDKLSDDSLTVNQVVKQYSDLISILTDSLAQASAIFVANYTDIGGVFNILNVQLRRKYSSFAYVATICCCFLSAILVTEPHFFSRIITPKLADYSASALRLIFFVNIFKLITYKISVQSVANSQSMLSTFIPYFTNIATLGFTILLSKVLAFEANLSILGFYLAQTIVFTFFGRFQYRFFHYESEPTTMKTETTSEKVLGMKKFRDSSLLQKFGILVGCATVHPLNCVEEDSVCYGCST